jgi:hypothetical protein
MGEEKVCSVLAGEPEEKREIWDLGVDGRTGSNENEWDGVTWLSWLRTGTNTGLFNTATKILVA